MNDLILILSLNAGAFIGKIVFVTAAGWVLIHKYQNGWPTK